ncbi:SDR family oxidoreductase [Chitinophaga horti]|uniref:SDR family oxidoreductase n=1 Tax=Chitinophaga horti TaxID=2920382 RepID=A0ABY6J2W2_9BACT|nr:SDR family oxidoreductase [Chitinophaga horti]UYQ92696.1 SDR family oxidoreductase [Chitinophaga horti]
MQKTNEKQEIRPPQHQDHQPGVETEMIPKPVAEPRSDPRKGRLEGKVAIITGGDSGIGRAVALAFADEGADVVISYLEEEEDAYHTRREVEERGRKAVCVPGDISAETHCEELIAEAMSSFGKIDILVNNAAVQYPQESIEDITAQQLQKTFSVNIFSMFYLTKAALRHMSKGACIINTTSVTAYRGSANLVDYSSTKGAIVSFTRALSAQLADKGIRVNAVAPGPVWTPLIPATFPADHVAEFGSDVPLKRAGQPTEIAPSYVFLASDDASYITGQVLHPNGGEVING